MGDIKTISKKLGVKERNYINYCEKFYFLSNAGFPTSEQAAVALGYSISEIHVFLQNKKVQESLSRRGLPWKVVGSKTGELTPVQVATAITVMNFADTRSIEQKLDELGILPQTYYAWLNDPTFNHFVNRLADKNLENIRPEAVTKFNQLVREGDFQAIKYYFEVTGEFKSHDAVNIQGMLQKVIESIQRHVKDPQVLAAISQDLLGAAPGVANNVTIDVQAIEAANDS